MYLCEGSGCVEHLCACLVKVKALPKAVGKLPAGGKIGSLQVWLSFAQTLLLVALCVCVCVCVCFAFIFTFHLYVCVFECVCV